MWCMNPAAAFLDLKSACRSIILTSGTLSPMDSFQSELDVKFDIVVEAGHVIDTKKQVWVASLANGPSPANAILNASYATAETFAFQDALGETIIQHAAIIPHGMLVFFPSYAMIYKMQSRWRTTGAWQRMELIKDICIEPKSSEGDFQIFNALQRVRFWLAPDSRTSNSFLICDVFHFYQIANDEN